MWHDETFEEMIEAFEVVRAGTKKNDPYLTVLKEEIYLKFMEYLKDLAEEKYGEILESMNLMVNYDLNIGNRGNHLLKYGGFFSFWVIA